MIPYNFLLFVVIYTILSIPYPFLKLDILKNIPISEFYIKSAFTSQILFLCFYLFYEKKEFKNLFTLDHLLNYKFLLYIVILVITLYLSAFILLKENKILKLKSYQRSLSLIFLTIYSIYIYKEKYNLNTILGIVTIIIGLYLLDN